MVASSLCCQCAMLAGFGGLAGVRQDWSDPLEAAGLPPPFPRFALIIECYDRPRWGIAAYRLYMSFLGDTANKIFKS